MHLARRLLIALLGLAALPVLHAADSANAGQQPELLAFAASSLTNVMDDVGAAYTARTGQKVKFSYAASSALAKQVEAGAQADVFFSADTEWMDYLNSRGLIDKSTRRDVLGNRLVLVAPATRIRTKTIRR